MSSTFYQMDALETAPRSVIKAGHGADARLAGRVGVVTLGAPTEALVILILKP